MLSVRASAELCAFPLNTLGGCTVEVMEVSSILFAAMGRADKSSNKRDSRPANLTFISIDGVLMLPTFITRGRLDCCNSGDSEARKNSGSYSFGAFSLYCDRQKSFQKDITIFLVGYQYDITYSEL